MTENRLDVLWNESFNTYYDAFYEEIVADEAIRRWQFVDETAAVLVALTATGSAVAGWALWTLSGWRIVWSVFAGLVAVLAIVHKALAVPGRLKGWNESQRSFVSLRIELETFRSNLAIGSNDEIDDLIEKFNGYRKRFGDAINRRPNDIVVTKRMEHDCQDALNRRLEEQIARGDENNV